MQVLLAATLIDALHAAPEDRKIAFNRVGEDLTHDVLALALADHAMVAKLATSDDVVTGLIGSETG